MSDEEYERIQSSLISHAAGLSQLDIKGFLKRLELSIQLGQTAHPELYATAGPTMKALAILAENGLGFQEAFQNLQLRLGITATQKVKHAGS